MNLESSLEAHPVAKFSRRTASGAREAARLGKIGNNVSPPPPPSPTPDGPEPVPTTGFRGNWGEYLEGLQGRAVRYARATPASDLTSSDPRATTNDGPRRQLWRLLAIRRWVYLSTAPEYSGEVDPWLLRLSGCRHVVTGGGVTVRGAWSGSSSSVAGSSPSSAHVAGVVTCGSVWTCPACAEKIKLERAAEVRQSVDYARRQGHRVSMLTLTVDHGAKANCAEQMAGVAKAYRRVLGGEPWRRWSARWSVRHSVRALELTDGRNGWHVHLHVLLIHDGELGEEAREPLARRWSDAVADALGEHARPRVDAVGCHLKECEELERGDYLAKMGLELGLELCAVNKGPRSACNWTVWDLLAWSPIDAVARGRWLDYSRSSKGRKFLTWSKGFRAAAGLLDDEPSDEEAAAKEPEGRVFDIGHLTPHEWRAVRRAMDGEAAMLCAYRDRGVEAGRAVVLELVHRAELVDERQAVTDRDEHTPCPEADHPPRWDLDLLT